MGASGRASDKLLCEDLLQSRLRMVEASPNFHRDDLAVLVVDEVVLVGSDVSFVFGGVKNLGGSGVVSRDVQ